MDLISSKSGLTKKDTNIFLDTFVNVVTDALAKKEIVHMMGFGDFEVREKSERMGTNPRTNEKIVIAARKTPAFKPSTVLKSIVNGEV